MSSNLSQWCPNCREIRALVSMGVCASCYTKILGQEKLLCWISPEESAGRVWALVYAEYGTIKAIIGVIQMNDNGTFNYKYVPSGAHGVEPNREAAMGLLDKVLEE